MKPSNEELSAQIEKLRADHNNLGKDVLWLAELLKTTISLFNEEAKQGETDVDEE